jgi:hypothetical protein
MGKISDAEILGKGLPKSANLFLSDTIMVNLDLLILGDFWRDAGQSLSVNN